jgi:hypothetical protein
MGGDHRSGRIATRPSSFGPGPLPGFGIRLFESLLEALAAPLSESVSTADRAEEPRAQTCAGAGAEAGAGEPAAAGAGGKKRPDSNLCRGVPRRHVTPGTAGGIRVASAACRNRSGLGRGEDHVDRPTRARAHPAPADRLLPSISALGFSCPTLTRPRSAKPGPDSDSIQVLSGRFAAGPAGLRGCDSDALPLQHWQGHTESVPAGCDSPSTAAALFACRPAARDMVPSHCAC